MEIIKAVSVCVIVLSITACASTGSVQIKTLTQDNAEQLIIVGKTSKADVKSTLGNAEVTPFASGDEIWVYKDSVDATGIFKPLFLHKFFAGSDKNIKELKVVFGKDGLVKKYQLINTGERQSQ